MTKHQQIRCFDKEKKDIIYNQRTGITKRLLEKYKPSTGLEIVNGAQEVFSEKRAA